MKALLIAALAGICCIGTLALLSTADPIQEVTYSADGLTCPSCATALQLMVAGVEGVQSAEVDYDSETVLVRYDSKATSATSIADQVKAVGAYELTPVDPDRALTE